VNQKLHWELRISCLKTNLRTSSEILVVSYFDESINQKLTK
jgi:hypothetical protein